MVIVVICSWILRDESTTGILNICPSNTVWWNIVLFVKLDVRVDFSTVNSFRFQLARCGNSVCAMQMFHINQVVMEVWHQRWTKIPLYWNHWLASSTLTGPPSQAKIGRARRHLQRFPQIVIHVNFSDLFSLLKLLVSAIRAYLMPHVWLFGIDKGNWRVVTQDPLHFWAKMGFQKSLKSDLSFTVTWVSETSFYSILEQREEATKALDI